MNHKLMAGYLALGVVSPWLLPAEVRACTCLPFPISSAAPKDGAQNVPLNAALQIVGAFVHESISLQDASGQPVEFTLHSGPTPSCPGTSAELVPKQPLHPETTYVVRVSPLYPEHETGAVTFTTGVEMLPDVEPEAPSGAASIVFDVSPDGFSCGSGRITACVSVGHSENVEVLARQGDEVVLRWMLSASEGTFKLSEQPDCIEMRRLSATGRRSAPVTICGDALRPRPFRESDRDRQGVVLCNGGVIGAAGTSDEVPDGGSVSTDVADAGVPKDKVSTERSDDMLSQKQSDTGDCSVSFVAPREPVHALAASSALMLAAVWRRRKRFLRQNESV